MLFYLLKYVLMVIFLIKVHFFAILNFPVSGASLSSTQKIFIFSSLGAI